MKRHFLPLLWLALSFLVAGPSTAATLDQQFDPWDPSLPGDGTDAVMYRGGFFSQTFTIGLAGTLDSVDLALSRLLLMESDLLFEITATTPTGEPIPTLGPPALVRIPYGAVPAGPLPSWVTVDLSGFGILVHEGERLALVLKLDVVGPVPADPSRAMEILWHGRSEGAYTAGAPYAHPSVPGSLWHLWPDDVLVADLGFRTWVSTVREVMIDVKPGSDSNPVNPASQGSVAVAVLGAPDFPAADIDPATLSAAGAAIRKWPNGQPLATLEDVNSDGFPDLVFHVRAVDLDFPVDSARAEVVVVGRTRTGLAFRGTDWVTIVN
jgi:hypothetical protein